MAKANLGRNKKKTVLVVISLSLAVALLQATYTFAIGFDMDKYLEKWVVSDFILGNAAYFQYNFRGSEHAVPEEDILSMQKGANIAEDGRVYGQGNDGFEYVTEEMYREYYNGMDAKELEKMLAAEERDLEGKLPVGTDLYGMEDYPISKLEVIDGSIDDLYDPKKNVIAAVYQADDYGNAMESGKWAKTGDLVKIRYVYEWEYLDAVTGEVLSEEEAADMEKEVTVREKDYKDAVYTSRPVSLLKMP